MYIRKLGVFLHPEKFFPFVTQLDSLGIKRTLFGSTITEKYMKKVLALPKPKYIADLRSAVGVIQYIARYIYNFAYFSYWLIQLIGQFEDKSIVKWTREAEQAWDAIQFLVAEAPLLYSPTINGQFCVTSDASMCYEVATF